MPADSLNELLSRWEIAKQQGQAITPEELCKGSPELLGEVKRHIHALQDFNTHLYPVAPERERRPAGPPPIHGYEILGELGHGGMGVVYKARHVSLKRLVALKMILGGNHVNAQQLARFRAEAEAVARLQHPNIVQIYEIGEQDGLPYLSLEYVDGGSLAHALDGTPQSGPSAAELVSKVARAMHAAHERGIVHRDLKPANILMSGTERGVRDEASPLAPDLSSLIPKISDFGLAKRLDEDSGQTGTGAVLGTASYMAPEQAGNADTVGAAADIYALGVILYEMLTGRPPFRAASVLDTLEQVRNQDPVPPSQLQPKMARDLETIVMKCLRKEPQHRYGSAAALADDLDRFLAGEPILARPVGRSERLVRWCRRKPASAALAALSLLAVAGTLTAAIGFGVYQQQVAEDYRLEQECTLAEERRAKRAEKDAVEKSVQLQIEERRAKLAEKEAVEKSLQLLETDKKRRQFTRLAVRSAQERGLALCTQESDIARGMLWLARGLQIAPEETADMQEASRAHLGAWHRHLHTLHARLDHQGPVRALAVNPNGKTVVTVSGHTAHIWSLTTGEPIGTVLQHDDTVTGVAISPDGKQILTGSDDKTARLWEADTGKPVGLPLVHPNMVGAVAYNPDGKSFAVAGVRHGRIWDAVTLQPIADLKGSFSVLAASIVYSLDGKTFATTEGGWSRMAIVWNAVTGRPVHENQLSQKVNAVAFTPDSRTLVTVGQGFRATHLFDMVTGKEIGTPLQHGAVVRALAVSPDGETILTGGYDNVGRLWNTTTGQARGAPLVHTGEVSVVAFSADGKKVVTGSQDQTARVWDAVTGKPLSQGLTHTGTIRAVAFSPDGQTVVTAGFDKVACIWKAPGPTLGPPVPTTVESVRFSPDASMVVTSSVDGQARSWDAETATELASFHHGGIVHDTAFSRDGKVFAVSGSDRTVRVRQTATGMPLGPLLVHNEPTKGIALSSTGQWIVTVSGVQFGSMEVRLFETATGKQIGATQHYKHHVIFLRFSPDGRCFVTGTPTRLTLWDTATATAIGESFPPETEGIHSVVFSPNGQTLLTASNTAKAQVRLWDTTTSITLLTLPHPLPVQAVAFSKDGKTLLTGCNDKKVRRWDLTGKLIGKPLDQRAAVTALAVSPDGETLLAGCVDGSVQAWHIADGRALGPILQHAKAIVRMIYRPDGKTLLTLSKESFVTRWDLAKHESYGPPFPFLSSIYYKAILSADGKHLLTCDINPGAQIRELSTGRIISSAFRQKGISVAVAFHPNGKTFATGSYDKTAQIWDTANGMPLGKSLLHPAWVSAVAFSPDGGTLATGCGDGICRLWDPATGTLLHQSPLASQIRKITFSQDGQQMFLGDESIVGHGLLWHVASGQLLGRGDDTESQPYPLAWAPHGGRFLLQSSTRNKQTPTIARLWDKGQVIGQPLPSNGPFRKAVFSPDGRWLVTATDKVAQFWDPATAKPSGPALPIFTIPLIVFTPDGKTLLTVNGYQNRLWDVATKKVSRSFKSTGGGFVSTAAFTPDGRTLLTGSQTSMQFWHVASLQPLGPEIPVRGDAVQCNPDGRTALALDPHRLIPVPRPVNGSIDHVVLWTQVLTGMELDDEGTVRVLTSSAWNAKRKQLKDLNGPPVE